MKYVIWFMLFLSLSSSAAVRVIDGDTIVVPIQQVQSFPENVSVRLIGINTAETQGAKCAEERAAGEAAKAFVRGLLANAKTVEYKFVRWDKYGGRVDGIVLVDGKSLADLMIESKHAVKYTGGVRVNVWCRP